MGLCFSASLNRPHCSGSVRSGSNNVGFYVTPSSTENSLFSIITGGSIDGQGSLGRLRVPLPPPLPFLDGQILKWPDLEVFSFDELKSATNNFDPLTVIGKGGFGRVYKGWLDENTLTPAKAGSGMAVAIKELNPESLQGFQEWQSELNILGRLSHPNMVKLLGYCWDENKHLLVYEFMPKGSLENYLFRRNPNIEPLSWNIRLKIAIGAARGLAFLHDSEKNVIYRDFKTSNILLDENYNAKISDFGLARLGPSEEESHVTTRVMDTHDYAAPEYVATDLHGKQLNYNAKISDFGLARLEPSEEESHVTTRLMGTYGYTAPEYVATGHLYLKSDVYGFGVVLLEILTGMRALDTKRPTWQQNLVEWTKPSLSSKKKLKTIMDSKIEGQYSPKAALQAAQLTLKCLEHDPKQRPSMKEVLEGLKAIEAIHEKSKESKTRNSQHTSHQPPRQSCKSIN